MLVMFFIIFFFFLEYIKMSEISDLTYYQKNRDLILNKKNTIKIIKRGQESKQEINTKAYLKKKKIKKENMGRIGIIKKLLRGKKTLF